MPASLGRASALRQLLALLGCEAAVEAMAITVEDRISLGRNPGAEARQVVSAPPAHREIRSDLRHRLRAPGAQRAGEPGGLAYGRLQRAQKRARRLVRDDRGEIEVDADTGRDGEADAPDRPDVPGVGLDQIARGDREQGEVAEPTRAKYKEMLSLLQAGAMSSNRATTPMASRSTARTMRRSS